MNRSGNKIKLPILSANQYAKQAAYLVKKGETIAAIEYYRKAIELDPKLPLRVYKGLGDALVKQGCLEEAVEVFHTVIQRFPKNPVSYTSLGDVLTQKGETENAIQQYRKAFELDSNQPPKVYQKLGNQLLKSNQFEAAEAVFKQLSEKYSERPQGYDGLARVALRSQQLEVAQQQWQKVLELFPDHIPAWVGLGNIFIEQGKLEEAEKLFQNLTEKYSDKPQGYEGLFRVAMRSQEWELAVEKLDLAISLFPEKLELLLQKINVLLKIPLFENAEKIIQQEKSRFLDDFRLDLAEANLYKQQFNYQEAQKILEVASLKYPDNIKIQLERADNYYQLGQEQAAQKILTLIRQKIWTENLPLIIRFTKIYVNILLRDYKIDYLKEYFDEARSHQVFNQEVMMNYYQVLMSQGMYQEASQLLEEMIREKVFTPKSYQDQILLLFELEKTKNIQTITQLKSGSELESRVSKDREPLLENIKLYFKSYLQFEKFNNGLLKFFDQINQLSQQYKNTYLNTYTSPFEAYRVALKIIDHIQNKIPLSLIRLGDGEGNFLDYEKEWQKFQEKDRETIQRTWWGCVRIDQNEWQKLKGDYVSAIQNADIIGIPEFYRFCRSFRIQLIEKNQTVGFRGLITIIHTLLNPSFYPEPNRIQPSDSSLTSCHIHHNLETWGLYQLIFNQIKDCSVISCHEEVSKFLQKQHGVTVKKFYKIPSEYKYSQLFDYNDQKNKSHYPDYFQQICSEITVSYQGEVFLVAAGFLGKIYCNIIKMKGGIALDVGSIADYWLNYTTRAFTQFPNQINYGSIFSQLIDQQNKSSQIKGNKSAKNDSENQRITARDYAKQAAAFVKQGETQTAIDYYQKAIELNPKLPLRVYKGLGDALVKQGCLEEAVEVFHTVIQRFPKNPASYTSLGDVLTQKGETEKAIDKYRKALDFNSNQPLKVYQRLGNQLLKSNQFEEAEVVFKKLSEKYPDKPQGYRGLIRVAMQLKDWALAVERVNLAISLFPDQPELVLQQKKVKNLLLKSPCLYQANLTNDHKVIALTFDDGPALDTPQILQVLQQHQIKATFFFLGQNLSQHPEIEQLVVHQGHAVGNHTWTHPDDPVNSAIAAEEIENTSAKIEQLTGVKTRLFRPPYGVLDNGVADSAKNKHYEIVMWSIDPQDYLQPDATILANQILTQVHPGAIILLHDGGGNRHQTVEALSIIIPQLKQQGYQFVTIPELLEIEANLKGTHSLIPQKA